MFKRSHILQKQNYYQSFHGDALPVKERLTKGVFKIQILKETLPHNETYLSYHGRRQAKFADSSPSLMLTSIIGHSHLVELLWDMQTDQESLKIQPISNIRFKVISTRHSACLVSQKTFSRKGWKKQNIQWPSTTDNSLQSTCKHTPLPAPMAVCKAISLQEALEEIFILLPGKKKRLTGSYLGGEG